MKRFLVGLVALLIAGAWLANNFRALTTDVRATIAEPATSTTSVIATGGLAASNATATGALATALVIQQLTMCILPLALLVVIALFIIAFIVARRHSSEIAHAERDGSIAMRQPPVVMIERSNAPSQPGFNTLMLAPRRKRRTRVNHVAKLAGRMFR